MDRMDSCTGYLACRERQHGLRKPGPAAAGLYPRLALEELLVGHRGCVNHVQFNESGSLLATGSDDLHICLWDLQSSRPIVGHSTGHTANIFCVKFMPTTGDTSQPLVASCAGDCEVRLHDVASGAVVKVYSPHTGRVKKLVTEPYNPHLIISCSEDGSVRQLDLRSSRSGTQLLQLSRNGVRLEINSIAAPWHKPWLLAVGASDDALRVYDRRMSSARSSSAGRSSTRAASCKAVCHLSPAGQAPHFASDCISGVAFADDGSQVLANYLGDYVYLWNVPGSSAVKRPAAGTTAAAQQGGLGQRSGSSGGGSKRSRADLAAPPTAAAMAATAAAGAAAAAEEEGLEEPAVTRFADLAAFEAKMAAERLAASSSPLQPPAKTRSRHRSAAGSGAAEGALEGAVGDAMEVDQGGSDAAAADAAAAGAAAATPQQQQQQQGTNGGSRMEEDVNESSPETGSAPSAAAAAAGGGRSRVLSVDDAVERLERGDLVVATRRRGAVASAILNRSQDLFERGELDASLRYALVALRLRPNFGMAHYQAATCYERLGMLQQALEEAEKALEMAWGYDLQQFVRRIRRRLSEQQQDAAAAAAAAAAGQSSEDDAHQAAAAASAAATAAAAEHGHRRRHRSRRHRRRVQTASVGTQTGPECLPELEARAWGTAAAAAAAAAAGEEDTDAAGAGAGAGPAAAAAGDGGGAQGAVAARPLPPALQRRLQARGILPQGDAAAAAASPAAAPAAAAADGGGAAADGVDGCAAAVAAASGSSHSWAPDSQQQQSGSTSGGSCGSQHHRGARPGVKSAEVEEGGQDLLPSDDVDTDLSMGQQQQSRSGDAEGGSGSSRSSESSSGGSSDESSSSDSGGSDVSEGSESETDSIDSSGGSDGGSESSESSDNLGSDSESEGSSGTEDTEGEGSSEGSQGAQSDEDADMASEGSEGGDSWNDDDESTMLGLDEDRSFFDWGGTEAPAAKQALHAYQQQQQQQGQQGQQQQGEDQQQQPQQGRRLRPRVSRSTAVRTPDQIRFGDLIAPVRNQLALLELRREEQLPRLFARRLHTFRQRYEVMLLSARQQLELLRTSRTMAAEMRLPADGALEQYTQYLDKTFARHKLEQQQLADQHRQQSLQQQGAGTPQQQAGLFTESFLILQQQILLEVSAQQGQLTEEQQLQLLERLRQAEEQQQQLQQQAEGQQQQQQQDDQDRQSALLQNGMQQTLTTQQLQQQQQQQQQSLPSMGQQQGQQPPPPPQQQQQQQQQSVQELLHELDAYERHLIRFNKAHTRAATKHSNRMGALHRKHTSAGGWDAVLQLQLLNAQMTLKALDMRTEAIQADRKWADIAHRLAVAKAGAQTEQQQQQQQQQRQQGEQREHPALLRAGRAAAVATAAAHVALLPEFAAVEGTMRELLAVQEELQGEFQLAMQHTEAKIQEQTQRQEQQQQQLEHHQDCTACSPCEQAAAVGSASPSHSGQQPKQSSQVVQVSRADTDTSSSSSSSGDSSSGSSGDGMDSDTLDEWDHPIMSPEELLTQDDPVLLEIGRLLAAGDPLSEAYGSSSSSKRRHWQSLELLGQHNVQHGGKGSCSMEQDAPAAAAAAGGSNTAAAAAAAGASHGPAVGSCDLGYTAAVADGPEEHHNHHHCHHHNDMEVPGGLLSGRQNQWACRYRGHVSLKTIKDVSFVGPDQSMVAAGSDDGRMFIWDRYTGALITAVRADRYVVNCIDSHPTAPMLASCGIDATVKLWSPCLTHPRALRPDLLYSMGYNEVERAAVGAANMFRGFSDMCKAFSKQHADKMVARMWAEHQQHRQPA